MTIESCMVLHHTSVKQEVVAVAVAAAGVVGMNNNRQQQQQQQSASLSESASSSSSSSNNRNDDDDDNGGEGDGNHENSIHNNSSSSSQQHASSSFATAGAAVLPAPSVSSTCPSPAVAASAVAVSATATTTTTTAEDHPHVTEETGSNNDDDDSSAQYSSSYDDSSDSTSSSNSSSSSDYQDDHQQQHPHRHAPREQQQQQQPQQHAMEGEGVRQIIMQGVQSSSTRIITTTQAQPAAAPPYRLHDSSNPQQQPQISPQTQLSAAAAAPSAAAAATTVTAAFATPTAAATLVCTTRSVESTKQQQQQQGLSYTIKQHTKPQQDDVDNNSKMVGGDDSSDHDDDDDADVNFELALVWQRNKRVLLGRLEECIPRGRLSLINLSRRGLGLQEAILLKHAIQSNPQLSVLKLGYNDLRDEGAVVIAKALQCCPNANTTTIPKQHHHANLTVLDLGFNTVGNVGVEALAVHALAGNYTLETLYLSGNVIGPKGAFSIAAAILHGTGLCKLHLAGNQIGAVGIKAIAGAIAESDSRLASAAVATATAMATNTNSSGSGDGGVDGDFNNNNSTAKSIVELHVGNANIGSAGFLAIPGMLLSNITLRSLSVTNNGIDDQAMLLLAQALSQNKNVPLETMHFSVNEITDQGVECLMNAIWGSKFLRELKLDNNKIQDRGAQLCAVVLTSIPLHVLDLSFNRITTTGIKAIMRNISENDSLKTLGMSGIPIDQHASKAVSFALAYNSSLNVLHLDNCSAGYSAQRHIVAGVVSNRRASLRVLTGFALAPITMTLGMPRIPEEWSNAQVLGFVRLMWQQWLVKSGHGNVEEAQSIRGPAPPAAVAAAAKIAFSSLGLSPQKLFQTETHDKPLSEGAPVDSATSALLERTQSGTLGVPSFSEQYTGQVLDWVDADSKAARVTTMGSPATVSVPSLDDPEQRNRNLQWLRTHFRSLSEVGRLPFNNADLWQLHQYYFSPPVYPSDDSSDKSMSEAEGSVAAQSSQDDAAVAPPPTPAVKASNPPVSRAISFHALGDALAAQGLVGSAGKNNKRRSSPEPEEDNGPASKRAKNLKPRIAYYPRLMAKIQSLGTRPMDQTLSLLRQLKYSQNLMFAGMDPYGKSVPGRVHRDIEMILVDLL